MAVNDIGLDVRIILLELRKNVRMIRANGGVDKELAFLLGGLDGFLPVQLPGSFFGGGAFSNAGRREMKAKSDKEDARRSHHKTSTTSQQ
jgi:hypothetical protein